MSKWKKLLDVINSEGDVFSVIENKGEIFCGTSNGNMRELRFLVMIL